MSCSPAILICFLLTGLSLLQISHSEGAVGHQEPANATSAFQYVQNFLNEIFSLSDDSDKHSAVKCSKEKNRGQKGQNEIDCSGRGKFGPGNVIGPVIDKTDGHAVKKKQLEIVWDQDIQLEEGTNGTQHKITKRQASVYFQQRTDEELDYRDHWQLGLKKAFFNTLTYVEKRIQDDEKRYKLWMKIKRSRFLKRKFLMGLDDAEHNKFGVIINRNVKFEIRQTDSAIYECISKTCKPDPDVTAVWKIRTIDSENVERDVLPLGSEQDDEYYATGSRHRNVRYRSSNRRLGRYRRHVTDVNKQSREDHVNSPHERMKRFKRDISEKIVDDFSIEEKLRLENELSKEEVIRYKRNRSLFEQQTNKNMGGNNDQMAQPQNQRIPQQTTQRNHPKYQNTSPTPTGRVTDSSPWKPITSRAFQTDLGRDYIIHNPRYLQDQSLDYLSAKEKYRIPVNNFDLSRINPESITPKILEAWKAQPIVISNAFQTPKVVQILPTAAIPKEQLNFLRQTFNKNYDFSGLQLEAPANRINLKEQRIPLLNQQQFLNPNNPQYLKVPVLPTRITENTSHDSLEDLKISNPIEPNRKPNAKPTLASVIANQYKKPQDTFDDPWMSLRIQTKPPGMVGQNSANYAKIQTLPSRPNLENTGKQNIQPNTKPFKPRLIEESEVNSPNLPNSRFKPQQEVYPPKNVQYNERVPQPQLPRTEKPIPEENVPVRRPENIEMFYKPYGVSVENTEKPKYQSSEEYFRNFEVKTPTTNPQPQYSTEPPPTQWSQLPLARPESVQGRKNNLNDDNENVNYETSRHRNINPNDNSNQKSVEDSAEERVKSTQQTQFNSAEEEIRAPPTPTPSSNLEGHKTKDQNEVTITNTERIVQEITQKSTIDSKDPPNIGLDKNQQDPSDTLDQFEDEVGEGEEYEDEYDDYEEEDYEDTDEEPQIIKTSLQHCKALAKNTLVLSRSKNVKFSIKPMLIFFKTNFDSFVKEHCYLYTTAKDLKILNNDLNLEAEERKKKRILRSNKNSSKPYKRNLKKKYKNKNYKRYRTYNDYDESDEDVEEDFYRDSFESYGKRRTNEGKPHIHLEPESNGPNRNIGSKDKGFKKSFTPRRSQEKSHGTEHEKDISVDKQEIESIHNLFNIHDDYVQALKLSDVNLADDVQSIRRIDDGNYRIIIYPKTLLQDQDEIKGNKGDLAENKEKEMQSRMDNEEDVTFLEDNASFLKSNKKFRFPTEKSVTQISDRIGSESFVGTTPIHRDNTQRVTEKFTLGDLPSFHSHEIAYNQKENNQRTTERAAIPNTFKFPQLENFFDNRRQTTDHYSDTYTNNKNVENNKFNLKTSVNDLGSNQQRPTEIIDSSSNEKFNPIKNSKDKLFKPKGQVINEIVYIPNHPLEQLFGTQSDNSQPNFVKKLTNIITPQTINLPSFQNNKDITVSSQILVGKTADKIINAEEFFRSNNDDEMVETQMDIENEKKDAGTITDEISRRQDDMDHIEIAPIKNEFGPIMKDGFLPILPMVMERSSNSDSVQVAATTENILQNRTKPMAALENNSKNTKNKDDIIPLMKPPPIVIPNIPEPLQMNLFDTNFTPLPSIMTSPQNKQVNDPKTKEAGNQNEFKPSYSFTMYSEPDPSFVELNGTDQEIKTKVETQTEDGQFIYYATERTISNTEKKVLTETMQKNDAIKIIDSGPTLSNSDAVSKENTSTAVANNEEKDIKEESSNKSDENNSSEPIIYENVFVIIRNKTDLKNGSASKVIPSKTALNNGKSDSGAPAIHPNNTTINKEDTGSKDSLLSNVMQLFQDNGERGKENQRNGHEISNKAGAENNKETQAIDHDQETFLQKISSNETAKEDSSQKRRIPGEKALSANEIIIRNIKSQREKLFLENNIKKHTPSPQKDSIQQDTVTTEQTNGPELTTLEDDLATTDSTLFLYKTVTSIIEKTPVTTNLYSENTQDTNLPNDMFSILMPIEDRTVHDRSDKVEVDSVQGTTTERVSSKTNENKIKANVSDIVMGSYSKINRMNSKASTLRKNDNENISNVDSRSSPQRDVEKNGNINVNNHSGTNTTHKRKHPDVSLPSEIIEKNENLLKNIIAESLKSYKSANFTKMPLNNLGKTINTSRSISNQYLKATTFHPIHFRTATTTTEQTDSD
ncbi:hypothetical protein M8J77_015236 [Diaphorina citri]|nr:hypothetical protein M8J77_015236 [Diaphorina citri]